MLSERWFVKTMWKILLTFGILALFIMVIAVFIVFLATGFSEPSLGAGYIAVIPIKGEITSGGCGGSLLSGEIACANSDEVKKMIKDANDDWTVDAILLDIDSGGGAVVATREITTAVKSSKKPVVAYIGETGASGAYYIASAARRIVADDNSLTGSIGVRMEIPHYYDLMGKIGVNVTTIKAGGEKDVGSPYRPMTEEERRDLQDIVDVIFDDFIEMVAVNRNMSAEYVKSIAEGKVYVGSKAKEIGLVDELGGFDYALEVAASEAGIEGEPKVKNMAPERSLRDFLSAGASNGVLYSIVKYLG